MSISTNAPTGLPKNLLLPSSIQLNSAADAMSLRSAGGTTVLSVGTPAAPAMFIDNATAVVTFTAAPRTTGTLGPAQYTGPSVTVGPANDGYAAAFDFATAGPLGAPLASGEYLVADAASIGAVDHPELAPAFRVFWDGTRARANQIGAFTNNANNLLAQALGAAPGPYSDGTVNDLGFGVNNDGLVTVPPTTGSQIIVSQNTVGGNASTHQVSVWRLV